MSGQSPVELLDEAARLPAHERVAFLQARCGSNAALRAEVESLLGHLDAATGFMSEGLFRGPIVEPKLASAGMLAPGTRVWTYRIERVLGEGGMGVVYVAVQDNPSRCVALKVIRPGAGGRSLLARFQREAQLLGRLQHPGIAQIFEAGVARLGETEGAGTVELPFLAMELVEGVTLAKYASDQHLSVRGRLELVAKVCEAVEHAHQRGLIHRDLKPGNILVTPAGQPKVLDFGVARALDQGPMVTMATEAGQLIGTVAYMSPEQIRGDPLDARSDVYTLGVILYELLSGRLPHDVRSRTVLEAAREIQEAEPTRLSTIGRGFRGDVDTIVLRALEKDRDRRYLSAAALADDLRRYLTGEPILARQDSALYVLNKQLRRYRWAVGTGVVFLALGVAFGVWAAVEARAFEKLAAKEALARSQAVAHEQEVQEQLRISDLERGRMLASNANLLGAERALWSAFAEKPGAADAVWALREVYLRHRCLRVFQGADEDVFTAGFSPDGRLLATGGDQGQVDIWNSATGETVHTLRGHAQRLNVTRFSPDGMLLATAGLDSVIRLWNVPDWSPAGRLIGHRGSMAELAFTRDGGRLYSIGQDGVLRVWDVCHPGLVREIATGHSSGWSVCLNPSETLVVTCDFMGFIQVRETQGLSLLREIKAHEGPIQGIACSPDGSAVVSGGRDGMVALWNTRDWSLIKRTSADIRNVRHVEFSPDGARLVVTGTWSTCVLDARTLAPMAPALPDVPGGWKASFSPDGQRVVTTGTRPGAARVWAVGIDPVTTRFRAHAGNALFLASNTEGSLLASGSSDGAYSVWDSSTRKAVVGWTTRSAVRSLAFSPDGGWVATAHANGTVRASRLNDRSFRSLRGHRGNANAVAYLPDGRLVSGGADATIRVWNAADGVELKSIDAGSLVNGLAASPDGRWIVANTADRIAMVWDAGTYAPLAPGAERAGSFLARIGFSPDSTRLVMSASSGALEIWDPFTSAHLAQLSGHTRSVARALYSPDGAAIASVAQDGVVRLWEPATGRCLASFPLDDPRVSDLAWLSGGRRLAVASSNGEIWIWDFVALDERIAANGRVHMRTTGADAGLLSGGFGVLRAAPAGPGAGR